LIPVSVRNKNQIVKLIAERSRGVAATTPNNQ